jgi:hypothetical protein
VGKPRPKKCDAVASNNDKAVDTGGIGLWSTESREAEWVRVQWGVRNESQLVS